jgi:hypothetical protein
MLTKQVGEGGPVSVAGLNEFFALRNEVPLKLPLVFFDFLKSLNFKKIGGRRTRLRKKHRSGTRSAGQRSRVRW